MNFRHRVTFRNDTSADGEVDPTYTDFLSAVPCNVVPVSGVEKYNGRQLQSETQIVIETRYYDSITQNMIAVNDITSETYLIHSALNVEGRSRELFIQATEVEV